VRLEQLYPFPRENLQQILESYPDLEEIDWIQEEPQNMGAWTFVRPHLAALIAGRWSLHYIGRPPSSSPAEGSAHWYKATQQALVESAFAHQFKDELIDSKVINEVISARETKSREVEA
jgi:2-oxoglutarate dehydrogenase E1 component